MHQVKMHLQKNSSGNSVTYRRESLKKDWFNAAKGRSRSFLVTQKPRERKLFASRVAAYAVRRACITFSSAHLISARVDRYFFSLFVRSSIQTRSFSCVSHSQHIRSVALYTSDILLRTPKELSIFYQGRVLVSYFHPGSDIPFVQFSRDWKFSRNLIPVMIFSLEYTSSRCRHFEIIFYVVLRKYNFHSYKKRINYDKCW